MNARVQAALILFLVFDLLLFAKGYDPTLHLAKIKTDCDEDRAQCTFQKVVCSAATQFVLKAAAAYADDPETTQTSLRIMTICAERVPKCNSNLIICDAIDAIFKKHNGGGITSIDTAALICGAVTEGKRYQLAESEAPYLFCTVLIALKEMCDEYPDQFDIDQANQLAKEILDDFLSSADDYTVVVDGINETITDEGTIFI